MPYKNCQNILLNLLTSVQENSGSLKNETVNIS
jgi:hypothetical protein